MKPDTQKRGFTLIELLVVVAIISILSSVVLASLSVARKKALGTQFGENVRQLEIALFIYNENHGSVPGQLDVGSDGLPVNWPDRTSYESESPEFKSTLQPLLDEKIISALPKKPVSDIDFYYVSWPASYTQTSEFWGNDYYTCGSQPWGNYTLEFNLGVDPSSQTILNAMGLPKYGHVQSDGTVDPWDGSSYCVTGP